MIFRIILIFLFVPGSAICKPLELEEVISWGVDNARSSTGWGLVGYRKSEIEPNQDDQAPAGWGLGGFEKNSPVLEDEPNELEVLESKNMTERQLFIMEQAITIGAQAGYDHELKRWNQRIEKHSEWLHKNFRLTPLMLRNGTLLPPVLTTSVNNASLSDDAQIIRTAGQVFRIVQKPKFVITPPTWESYLLSLSSSPPEKPGSYDLPQSAEESLVWEHYITKGWNEGIRKVEIDYRINIARLRRDIVGMSLYHILLGRGMISEPIISKSETSVSGDDETLVIDDKNLEITVVPKMQHEAGNWRPVGQVAELFGRGLLD